MSFGKPFASKKSAPLAAKLLALKMEEVPLSIAESAIAFERLDNKIFGSNPFLVKCQLAENYPVFIATIVCGSFQVNQYFNYFVNILKDLLNGICQKHQK